MIQASVILATYNRAATLPRAIDSVLVQTLKDIELIIVNDGSTDSTKKILIDHAKKDQRVKVITQNNQGLAKARNNGVAVASGKYIAFMDSDDACVVNHLEFHHDFLENNTQYSACILRFVVPITDYYPKVTFKGEKEHSICQGSPFNTKQYCPSLGPYSFITRESFIALGGYRTQETIIEDLDFTLRYVNNFSFAQIHGAGSYFYTFPQDNSNEALSNNDVATFIKRHIACHISEWC